MTREDVQGWLDDYVEAWRTYDAGAIADLFTEDASYGYNPWDDPITGREAIVAAWLSDQDAPDSWTAEYRPFVVAGDIAVAVGETRYADGKVYFNSWQLTFDHDGKCSAFVEWYMAPPAEHQ